MDNLQEQYKVAATKNQEHFEKKLAADWNITIDPEFKNLLIEHSNEEHALFEHSLLTDGCRDALIVWNNNGERILVDGHNRYGFCEKNGIPFSIIEREFRDREAVKEWIILNQLARRNLPMHRRAQLAIAYRPIIEARAKENQLSGLKQNSSVLQNSAKRINTREELAKFAGVSRDTIDNVDKIEQNAPEPVKQAARKGEISVNAAYQVTKMEQEEQDEIARRIDDGEQPQKAISDVKKQYTYHNQRGWTKEDRENREKTMQILELTHNSPIPEYTLDMLIEDIKLDADNYFSILCNRLTMSDNLVKGENANTIGKVIDEYIIYGVEEIRRKVS